MSGGLYGRGKAPERACMKLDDWPPVDRQLWQAAVSTTDLFSDSGGTRANHRPISNRNIEKGYGRFLTYLKMSDLLDEGRHPADRITKEVVIRFCRRARPPRQQEGHHHRASGGPQGGGQGVRS